MAVDLDQDGWPNTSPRIVIDLTSTGEIQMVQSWMRMVIFGMHNGALLVLRATVPMVFSYIA